MKIRVLELIRAILLHLIAIQWGSEILEPGGRENIVFRITYKGLYLRLECCGTYDDKKPKSAIITLGNNETVLGFGGWNWYESNGVMWFKYNRLCFIDALELYIKEASPRKW